MIDLSVDFLLGPDLSSRLIAWYGWGYGGYSHAASVLADGRYLDARSDAMRGVWRYGPHMGLEESVPAGVHVRDPHWERSVKRTRATLEVTLNEYADWEDNMRAKIGTPYAKADIWGFITGRRVSVNGMWDCSQLAINGLQHIRKFPFPLSVPAHQITPNSLLLMMEAIGARLSDPGL